MHILLIHIGFPGQFKHLVPKLLLRGYKLWAISKPRKETNYPTDVNYHSYNLTRGNGTNTHPLCHELESKIIRGEAVARKALELKSKGFKPDLILGHPGWGEMLFLGDIWPQVPQLHYVEFFHGVPGTDNDFDGGINNSIDWWERARARMKNAQNLSSLNTMKVGLCPTYFQHRLLPQWAAERTHVIHDGIDCKSLKPNHITRLEVPKCKDNANEILFKPGDPIITFINRTFEPYRGIHIFLEALIDLQSRDKKVQVILVGKNTPHVSYGKHREDGNGWLTALRKKHGDALDWNRIHALGTVSHKVLKCIYQVSAVHVYLSYPFVLSWSMLEAMSSGCLVVGSDTEPVREVIKHGQNGLLVPFKNAKELSNTLLWALKSQNKTNFMKFNARKTIQEKYELTTCLNKQLALIEDTF